MYNFSEDLDFITAQSAPFLPEIEIAFLGGSQVIQNGQFRTQNSDHDLLLIGDHIEKPVSLIVTNPKTGRHFDVILRDRETLAYDVKTAREAGKGTLLHLAAYSQILLDRKGRAEWLQQKLLGIHKEGPYPVDIVQLWNYCERLSETVLEISKLALPAARQIALLHAVHDIGTTALRGKRLWVGKGKILGRFLLENVPAIKTELEGAYYEALQGRYDRLAALPDKIADDAPLSNPQSRHLVPFVPEPDFSGVPADADEAFHAARMSREFLLVAFNSPVAHLREGARQWFRFKHDLIAKSVNPERMGRDSNEYFYALARYVRHLTTMHMLASNEAPQTSLSEQAKLVAARAPFIGTSIKQALCGNPSPLLRHGYKLLESLVDVESEMPPRSAPATHRANPFRMGL